MISQELRINPWILMLAFTVLVGPFALNFHMHYPDEIFFIGTQLSKCCKTMITSPRIWVAGSCDLRNRF